MGSGKTTTQNALVKRFIDMGIYPRVINFASTIYNIHDYALKTMHNLGILTDVKKDGKLLQLLGTEWGRSIDPDIWVQATRATVDASIAPITIIGDCRFRNEFDAFPDALRVRLHAPRIVRKNRCESWRDNEDHPSETDLDVYDVLHRFDLDISTFALDTEQCVGEIIETFYTDFKSNR